MEDNGKGYGPSSMFWSFVLGGIVGMGALFLYAPRSGRETRQKMREAASDARVKASDYFRGKKEKVSSVIEEGKEVVDREVTGLKSAVSAGKKAYQEGKQARD